MKMSLDLYVDYLISSTSYTTATGLSKLVDNQISHDQVTRFLSSKNFTSADLWLMAKPLYKTIASDDGVLALDDTIECKPYTDENEVISYHWDHKENKSVKGINFVSALYETSLGSVPLGFEPVRKDLKVIDKKTQKTKRKASVSKQQHYRSLIKWAIFNDVNFKYILNDIWFSSVENMDYIKNKCKKDFIMAVKSNRKVALSEIDKQLGKYVGIDSMELGEGTTVWLKDLDFPLRLTRQVFKNEDGSTGVLYLVSSDIELTDEQAAIIYKKRWKIEVYHKSIKSNSSLAKSPGKTPRTQINHLFASLCGYIRLENISKFTGKNHFALKYKIYIQALKVAMRELQKLANETTQIVKKNYAPA